MAYENIEDIIKKVVLGESFSSEPEQVEEEIAEEENDVELNEAKKSSKDEDEEDMEDEDEEDSDEEEEDSEEEDEEPKSKKFPAFLKKKGSMKMKESADVVTANGKDDDSPTVKGSKIAKPTGDASAKNKATIKAKASDAKATAEGFESIFAGQELSEEFVSQATTLFEAHLNERVHAVEEELQAKYETLLEEHTASVAEELVGRVDEYLNYVVEEWMQENKLAVENGLRTEVTEGFIANLRNLFAESYIEIPEDKLDLFESAVEENGNLEDELGGQVEKNLELTEENTQLRCEIIFREISEGLTDTEIQKLRRLSEDVEFETVEQFAEKLSVLAENISSIGSVTQVEESQSSEEGIEESFEDASEVSSSPLMEAYMRSMTKSK